MSVLASLWNWQLFCVWMTEHRLLEQLKLLHTLTGEKVKSTMTTNSCPTKNFKDKGNHHTVFPCSWEPGLQSWISLQPSLTSQKLQPEVRKRSTVLRTKTRHLRAAVIQDSWKGRLNTRQESTTASPWVLPHVCIPQGKEKGGKDWSLPDNLKEIDFFPL